MEKILEFLKTNRSGSFATVEDGKQPRVRPFGFGYYEDGKFWFCTNNQKKVYNQLQDTPYSEVCFAAPGYSQYLRLSGHVEFDTSIEAKTKLMQAMPGIKGIYGEPGNPIFEVFYIEKGEAVLSTFPPSPDKPDHIVKF